MGKLYLKISFMLLLLITILLFFSCGAQKNKVEMPLQKSLNLPEDYSNIEKVAKDLIPDGDSTKEPIKVIFIWHMHQPSYKIPGTLDYEMPWVRAHGVNDYPYMADLLKYLTKGKVTFNFTPVLLLQIDDYVRLKAQDKYMKLSLKKDLTKAEKEFILNHFFDINPRFVNKYPRYKELREKKNKGEVFTDQDILDLKVCWNLYWINIDYINADPKLKELVEKGRDYSWDDLEYVINKHYEIMATIVEKYKRLWQEGKIEMTTSPYYHPILPILVDMGWKEDAIGQIKKGIEYFEKVFGKKPVGLWPSEEAVSTELVPIFNEANVEWIVTDKDILQKAGVNASNPYNLYTPYKVEVNGKSVYVFFRDTDLSNRLSFKYSQMKEETAVRDLLTALHNIQRLNNSGDLVVTIAMDGENAWEHYPNNGNYFRKLLYVALSNDPYVELITPDEYLKKYGTEKTLNVLPKGSWAGGSLDIWIGEKEEDEAWERLRLARKALFDNKDKLTEKEFEEALDILYAAEGSDWFWWYGDDQDAGTNELLFDMQFKKLLIMLYRKLGYTDDQIPAYLFVANKKPARAEVGNIGKLKAKLDGILSEEEIKKTAYFKDNDSITMYNPDDLIKGIHVGRDLNGVYIAVEFKQNIEKILGKDYKLEIYTDYPGETRLNMRTKYSKVGEGMTDLGFALARRFSLNLKRPKNYLFYYTAGGNEVWTLAGKVKNSVAIDKVVEIIIPYDNLNVKPGDTFNLAVVISYTKKGEERDVDYAPNSGPVRISLPKEVKAKILKIFKDPIGDENGPGTYTYPKDGSFKPYKGLWDVTQVKVMESKDSYIFEFKFVEMTNPWNAPKGFSHQLINIYLDTKDGGRTDTYAEGARVQFDENHPWDYFIRAAGWPSYGQFFATADGQEIPESIQVEADPAEKIVRVFVLKDKLKIERDKIYAYFIIGSQDGYGPDFFRPVTPQAQTWTLGGYPADSKDFAPYVLDIIVPQGYDQYEILSSYDPNKEKYATLIPVEIPIK